jgi:hypothetical protein
MKTKLTVIASLTIASLLFAVYQPGNAVTYYGHDSSVDDYLTKTKVESFKGKQGYWVYIVKACADDYNLGVAAVILKSDLDTKVLGVNKSIKKGECYHYGAVMKAKNGNTLGAELIERHEALEKYNQILNDMSGKSIKEKKELRKELYSYRVILGGLV